MTEPKFQIGDIVSVFYMEGGVIIAYPQTEIVDREFNNVDEILEDADGHPYISDRDFWAYEVAAELGIAYAEECLRRINPDTEYLESPSHLEVPA